MFGCRPCKTPIKSNPHIQAELLIFFLSEIGGKLMQHTRKGDKYPGAMGLNNPDRCRVKSGSNWGQTEVYHRDVWREI